MTYSQKIFYVAVFSYWSKFHVNIITGSRVTTIFLYKDLTRNRKYRKSEISGDWGQVWDTQFGVNVSNEMLLNAPKCQGYTFYRF